ncbi:solute carrier organic anion transporter family member 3A1-like [Acanthaster planci]|uniref:Solute carrier organic anion transporter family member n=1 Tax=Acanthaster planci TaxID=133434 RepID=A0A8B7ZS01_ACAPL|nr:solute carrier organic anion transporter family member 3A1-like [Acanthaster planci]XP_022106226.1 solute carrier organic anion transporter family member 3A1-like [Acanthaster planci]XP_022106228.1 solute carrier organic anion transporter family member 3A1-like [Acanthaster planci]XP_022106229.1 solute carrier organic anion transporter family member 3A1-like [Acanthaster planci]
MMGRGFFHYPVAFGLCFTVFMVFQVSVGIYIGGILTTLERQYRIKSSLAGVVVSTSDFASLISIIAVTYVGKSWHRPRIIGVLATMTGIGGILSAVPHFIYPAYREGEGGLLQSANGSNATSSSIFVCDAGRELEECSAQDIDESGSRVEEMWALFLGQAIMGLAYGPLFPIALTYLDDQVKGTTTPYYISVFLTAGSSSTLVGFGQAFLFLTTNVNWPAQPDYTKEWIGAWWLGFLVDGVIILIIAIPFFFFPKEMDFKVREEDIPPERLAKEGKDGQASSDLGVKDFVASSKRIGTNAVFMMLLVSTIFELAVSASFGFFLAKFFEIRYNTAPSFSALLVGIIVMPGALLGNLTSGVLVKKLKLTSRGCGAMILSLTALVMCCIPVVYFLGCPEANYAGYTDGVLSISSPCNMDCTCTIDRFEPVCGADEKVYVTPCYAGCTGQRSDPTDDPAVNATVYTGCTCSTGYNATGPSSTDALAGKCVGTCDMLYYTGILLFCIVLFGSMTQNPLTIMQMRSVGKDKTFGLGISAFFSRALGFLPAPLYFGAAIEGACILERIECGVSGDCLIYNSQVFSLTFLGIFFGLKICNLFFYSIATTAAIRRDKRANRESQNDEKTKKVGVEGLDNKGFIGGSDLSNVSYDTKL